MAEEQASGYEKKGGYGKKPWWFWGIVYLVAGAIIYAGIYFLFLHRGTSLY